MSNSLNLFNTELLVLAAILLLTACGQKGPLYLPGNPSEITTEVPAAAQDQKTDEDTDDEEESDDQPE